MAHDPDRPDWVAEDWVSPRRAAGALRLAWALTALVPVGLAAGWGLWRGLLALASPDAAPARWLQILCGTPALALGLLLPVLAVHHGEVARRGRRTSGLGPMLIGASVFVLGLGGALLAATS
ncbi:MAG: hypothetical protein LWW86_09145 [Micrococcales bacterium]|nr:hypothetical protein [Micrococcales bacterium]